MCPWTINLWNHPASIWCFAEAIVQGRGKNWFCKGVSILCVCVRMENVLLHCRCNNLRYKDQGGSEGAVQLQFPPPSPGLTVCQVIHFRGNYQQGCIPAQSSNSNGWAVTAGEGRGRWVPQAAPHILTKNNNNTPMESWENTRFKDEHSGTSTQISSSISKSRDVPGW